MKKIENEENTFDNHFLPFPEENGLKIRSLSAPFWVRDDFAEVSKYDLFSEKRWGISVHWDVLYEHTKSISNIINLFDEDIYPSTLFDTYLNVLKANLNVFGNLFYYLTGEKIIKESLYADETQSVKRILHRLEFWNLDCIAEIEQISTLLDQIEMRLECILNWNNMHDVRAILKPSMRANLSSEKKIMCGKYPAYLYAYEEYVYPFRKDTAKKVAKQFETIETALSNYGILFFLLTNSLPDLDFNYLLAEFRKSERGKSLLKAWARDMECSRERFIDNLEKDPELGCWVHKYLHLRENEDVVTQLFYNETTGEVANKEKCYNTSNWISILKIATLLREYDERHNKPGKRVSMKTKPIKSFSDFIIDAERTDEIMGKLHRLIGNKTNTDALRIITRAMWIGWIERPTAPSIKNEFPTITCSSTIISRCLNEVKPTHPNNAIEKIRTEFETI